MKTITFSLLSALSLGTALIPSLANAQSFNRGEWRNGHRGRGPAPAVVVAPPVALPPAPVAVAVAPRVVVRSNVFPRPVFRGPVGYGAYGNTTLGEARERRQEHEIQIASMRGQLTPREYNRLMRGQAEIDALQSRATADGVVTPYEVNEIQRAQGFQDREIARLASNRRGGYGR